MQGTFWNIITVLGISAFIFICALAIMFMTAGILAFFDSRKKKYSTVDFTGKKLNITVKCPLVTCTSNVEGVCKKKNGTISRTCDSLGQHCTGFEYVGVIDYKV
jgi:hypothetical protein